MRVRAVRRYIRGMFVCARLSCANQARMRKMQFSKVRPVAGAACRRLFFAFAVKRLMNVGTARRAEPQGVLRGVRRTNMSRVLTSVIPMAYRLTYPVHARCSKCPEFTQRQMFEGPTNPGRLVVEVERRQVVAPASSERPSARRYCRRPLTHAAAATYEQTRMYVVARCR